MARFPHKWKGGEAFVGGFYLQGHLECPRVVGFGGGGDKISGKTRFWLGRLGIRFGLIAARENKKKKKTFWPPGGTFFLFNDGGKTKTGLQRDLLTWPPANPTGGKNRIFRGALKRGGTGEKAPLDEGNREGGGIDKQKGGPCSFRFHSNINLTYSTGNFGLGVGLNGEKKNFLRMHPGGGKFYCPEFQKL